MAVIFAILAVISGVLALVCGVFAYFDAKAGKSDRYMIIRGMMFVFCCISFSMLSIKVDSVSW